MRRAYRLELRGTVHVPPVGPLVVAANHASVVDPFVLGAALPRPLRFLAKEELWRFAVVGRVLDGMGAIPVARGSGDRGAMRHAQEALERAEAVAVFPEGTVRRHGPWLRGAARLALAAGAPMLPVRLVDTELAMNRRRVGFPRVAVLIGTPIEVDRMRPTITAARELTRRLEAAVGALGR